MLRGFAGAAAVFFAVVLAAGFLLLLEELKELRKPRPEPEGFGLGRGFVSFLKSEKSFGKNDYPRLHFKIHEKGEKIPLQSWGEVMQTIK